jgi:G:T/U-mismatch repair DNA glycosylase
MDTIELCYAEADDCLRRADIDTNENDKPLWVTLAQSWRQLAEDADRLTNDVRSLQLERAVEDALA